MVGTPLYGGKADSVYIETVLQIKHWCMINKIPLEFCLLSNQSSISHARNEIASEFLDSECTHLLFLDSDVGFEVDPGLKDMLGLDLDLTVGSYPKKQIEWNKVVEMALAGLSPEEIERRASQQLINPIIEDFDYTKIVELTHAPTGLMLIKRKVFEWYRQYFGEAGRAYTSFGKPRYNYFGTAVMPSRDSYISEDTYFCEHWRLSGGKIHFVPWVRAVHNGQYQYKADYK